MKPLMSKTTNKKISKLVKGLNSKTKALVLEILESPIKWDLICFYQANPFSIHTAKGLANIIGRRPEQVLKEAEELAKADLLKIISENGGALSIYAYEPSSDSACVIDMLVTLSAEERNLIDELYRTLKEDS